MKCDGSGLQANGLKHGLGLCPTCGQFIELSPVRRLVLHDREPALRLKDAAARVRRLSRPGTPERLFALQEVAAAMRLDATDIVDTLIEEPADVE